MASGEKVVSVFGANDPAEGDEAYEVARGVGRCLAELGYAVANGGYGGTMAASARGAKEAGGRTIGVTCSLWRSEPSEYIDEVVTTESLSERVSTLIELGRGGYVVLPGATGTLVELATVWEMMCKGMLPRRPVVCMGTFWEPLVEMMGAAREASRECVSVVRDLAGLRRSFSEPAGGSERP